MNAYPGRPDDLRGRIDLGRRITDVIVERMVPAPSSVAAVLGEDSLRAYYLMHALMHYLEFKGADVVVAPARRDHKAVQRHSYDSAFRPISRYEDDILPSGYLLTPREINGVLVHDLPEEVGLNPLKALIVDDIVRRLVGEQAGQDAALLTNWNTLLLHSLEDSIGLANMNDEGKILESLIQGKSKIKFSKGDIPKMYMEIARAFIAFNRYIEGNTNYIPLNERNQLLHIIAELSSDIIRDVSKKTVLSKRDIERDVNGQYEDAIGIMQRRDYADVDARLVLPGDPEFLLALKKTFYSTMMAGIAGKVKADADFAFKAGATTNDEYLAPMMEKLAETTDTVANLDISSLQHTISIFRKARIVVRSGVNLAESLRQTGVDYERLRRAVHYLHSNLGLRIQQRLEELRRLAPNETALDQDVDKFTIMAEKMGELEQRIRVIEANGLSVRGRDNVIDTLGVSGDNVGD